MLIETEPSHGIYLLAAIAVAGGLWALGWRRRSPLLFVLGLLIGGGLAILGPMQQAARAAPIVILKVGPGGVEVVERSVSRLTAVRFANGAKAEPGPQSDKRGTWIVNDTDRPVAVREVFYASAALSLPDQPVMVVAPYSLARADGKVRYWGRGEQSPPATVKSMSAVDSRLWLTWD